MKPTLKKKHLTMHGLIAFVYICGILAFAFANEEELPKLEAPSTCSTLQLDSFHPTCKDTETDTAPETLFRSALNQLASSCGTQSKNPCGCILSGVCEFNVTTKECIERNEACNYKLWDTQECRRAGNHIFYAVGGVVCNSKKAYGICEKEETLLAVNFNGKEHTDKNSIHHHSGWQIILEDPDKTRLTSNFSQMGVPQEDISLYNTQIYGKYATKKFKCATVRIPYRDDGHYELSIKTGQTVSWTQDRNFKFMLNGQSIVAEFKPNLYTKVDESMDLNVNFVIHSQGTYLQMTGYESSKLSDPNMMIPFSACYGTCKWPNVWSSWLIEALSVVKLARKLSCSVYNNNPCQCVLQDNCDYSVSAKSCIDKEVACKNINWNPKLCRRGGDHVLYSTGGIICKSLHLMGDCTPAKTIIAVNFNGEEHIDINKIHFLPEEAITIEDPDKTRQNFTYTQFGIPEADRNLYSTFIYGKAVKGQNTKCMAIPFKVAGDGHYEISIKTGQFTEWSLNRDFKYVLNGIPIVEEFTPRRYRENNFAFDLNVNFMVSHGETTLKMEGYMPSSIAIDKIVKFELCYGTCTWDPVFYQWQIAAFSVVMFEHTMSCSDFFDDACGCNYFGNRICEFNVNTRECTERSVVCSRPVWDNKQCRRAGAHIFYADGGTVCGTSIETGNCVIEKTLLAINYNGPRHTDRYGIPFQTETEIPLNIPDHSRFALTNPQVEIPDEDKVLYDTLIYSTSGVCSWVDIPIDGDGYYEISLKTGHFGNTGNSTTPNLERDFAYLLNGQYIVQEFTPWNYRTSNRAMDLNAGFKILNGGTFIKLSGHEPSRIVNSGNTVRFSVCSGTCSWPRVHRLWLINAISVVKFETKIACASYYANPCGCRFEIECEYNSVSSQCVDRNVVCNGAGSLGFAGECRRSGNHVFYMDAGVLCNNVQQKGDCTLDKTLFAINFGGDAFVDENGVEFSKDDGNPPYVGKRTGRATGWNGGLSSIYSTFIYNDAAIAQSGCFKLEIPIKEDGLYELNIKTGELIHNEINRCFNVWLNYKHILNEFFPALIRLPRNPFDIIINFRITNGATFIEISGFPLLSLHNFVLPLEFCPGSCSKTGHQIDHNWIISAVSVNKFK